MIDIKNALQNLDRADMARLLERVYGIYPEIDEIIEFHIESANSTSAGGDAIAKNLVRRIEEVAGEYDFIHYHQTHAYAGRLSGLLEDIDTLMRERDATAALELTERFLQLTEPVMTRADDSGGGLGEVFRQAADQWLDIAAQVRAENPDYLDWVKKVLYFFDNNDYGCLDDIISNSRKLLSREELRQLAWRFENDARKALSAQCDIRQHNSTASHACLGLESVAEATDDISLFEKSVLIRSPEPNLLQLECIVRFALDIQELERAEYWLQNPVWQNDPGRQSRLRAELLKQRGAIDELKEHFLQAFMDNPSAGTLENYWTFANKEEREGIKEKAEAAARNCDDSLDAVEMLLILGNTPLAAEIVIERADQLPVFLFSTMQDWADQFEAAGYPLAAAICYRALLTDLLERGYSKAYHHGARYFHKLIELDGRIEDYRDFIDSDAFIREIQKKHWRKRNFWAEAQYPNKPQ